VHTVPDYYGFANREPDFQRDDLDNEMFRSERYWPVSSKRSYGVAPEDVEFQQQHPDSYRYSDHSLMSLFKRGSPWNRQRELPVGSFRSPMAMNSPPYYEGADDSVNYGSGRAGQDPDYARVSLVKPAYAASPWNTDFYNLRKSRFGKRR
jgi:hypothetical protein